MNSRPEEEIQDFFITLLVRDYELDVQGVVNNANYFHYFEHARERYLHACGADFVALHNDGIDAMLHSIEIKYRQSLRSGNEFRVYCKAPHAEGRFHLIFGQEIKRSGDEAPCASCRAEIVLIKEGRPLSDPLSILVARATALPLNNVEFICF